MISIATYDIHKTVRISEEQYQKYIDSQYDTFSDFVKDAIDSYNLDYIEMKLQIFSELQEMWDKQIELVRQDIVRQDTEICRTISNLKKEHEHFQQDQVQIKEKQLTFEERIKPIIPTLQRLKFGESGLTNSNIEFQAKKVCVDTGQLKKWINEHSEIFKEYQKNEEKIHSEESNRQYKL